MDVYLGEQRALLLDAQITMDLARERVWDKRMSAFGALGRVTSLFQRSSEKDFELAYEELRYEPFWHVACGAHVVYEREAQYQLPVGGPEVKGVTIGDLDYELVGGKLSIVGIEHCAEEAHAEVFVDGVSGQQAPKFSGYTKFPAWPISDDDLNAFAQPGAIVLGTSVSASAVVRQVLAGMSRQIQASAVLEEGLEIQAIDLYFRPVYAFAVRWLAKGRTGVIQCDALTTEVSAGGKTYEGYETESLDPFTLFDITVDDVAEIVPGGRVFIAPATCVMPEEPEVQEPVLTESPDAGEPDEEPTPSEPPEASEPDQDVTHDA